MITEELLELINENIEEKRSFLIKCYNARARQNLGYEQTLYEKKQEIDLEKFIEIKKIIEELT